MTANRLSRAWIRLAAVYFVVGVSLGVVMGASGDHSLFPVHAHINLLGWVSMTMFGLLAAVRPALFEGRAAVAHFWLYNLGMPVMLAALALRIKGMAAIEPVIGIASIVVGVSVLLFGALVLTRIGRADGGAPASA